MYLGMHLRVAQADTVAFSSYMCIVWGIRDIGRLLPVHRSFTMCGIVCKHVRLQVHVPHVYFIKYIKYTEHMQGL